MTTFYSKIILIFGFFFCSWSLRAQENFTALMDPEVAVNLTTENRWSFNFSVSNRDIVYQDNNLNFQARHIELSHFSSYEIGFYSKLSLGIKYRFREVFDKDIHDELRIVEQFAHSRKYNALKTAHRARFEQRIRDYTIYRWRYRFSLEFPLSGLRVDEHEYFMVTSAEILYSVGEQMSPAPGNRFSISFGRSLGNSTTISLGLQYRYEDYFTKPVTELFFTSGLRVSI